MKKQIMDTESIKIMLQNFTYGILYITNRFLSKFFILKHSKKFNYKIIPFGNYCLPRVITTINGLKSTRNEGEKSFPFDLCYSNFNDNCKLLSNNFDGFYDDLKFDKGKYVNSKFNMIFNHDNIPLDEFKARYNKRIDNLYFYVKCRTNHLFFIVATFELITPIQIDFFIKEISKYRAPKTYTVIIINQSKEKAIYGNENVRCIDLHKDTLFNKINKKDDWVGELKRMNKFQAKVFNYKVSSKLQKIIKSTADLK